MKLPEQFIEELAKEIFGQDTVPLILLIKDKENVSEFKIAEKLNITINQVRNILYRLNEHNLVSSTRKKDKKKGWYIYFWTFENAKAKSLLIDHKRKKIEVLEVMEAAERVSAFYACPNSCIRLDTTSALECEFKCTECNSLLKEENKEKRLQQTREQIAKINRDIVELLHVSEEKAPAGQQRPQTKKTTKHQAKQKHAKKRHKHFSERRKPATEKPSRLKTVDIRKKNLGLLRRVKNRFFRKF